MSAGGALGGVFVGLVGPPDLQDRLRMAVGPGPFLCRGGRFADLGRRAPCRRPRAETAARRPRGTGRRRRDVPGGGDTVLTRARTSASVVNQARNFFGVLSIRDWHRGQPDHQLVLKHGTIDHGIQYLDPKKQQIPWTYYCYESGVGRCLQYLNERKPTLHVGVVGLGAGAIAAYARKGDTYRFYEINPEVDRFAGLHGKYFTFLRDAMDRGADVDVVMGDARLSLDREPAEKKYDVLVLDAFSGDSVPAHLLTREAFVIYRQHLAPGGVIAAHITNRYLYLAPVVRGIASDAVLGTTRVFIPYIPEIDRYRSDWMLLTEDTALRKAIPVEVPEEERGKDDFEVRLWTDQYNNLFSILKTARSRHGATFTENGDWLRGAQRCCAGRNIAATVPVPIFDCRPRVLKRVRRQALAPVTRTNTSELLRARRRGRPKFFLKSQAVAATRVAVADARRAEIFFAAVFDFAKALPYSSTEPWRTQRAHHSTA